MINKKQNKIICSILYLVLTYLAFFYVCKRFTLVNYSFDLLLIFTIANIFILMNFIIDNKKLYDFIYQKRYYIGLCTLLFLVLFKYSGTSIYMWNNYIEPDYKTESNIVFGIPRAIRSDEWLVSTPITLSQATDSVNFSKNNNLLRGRDNLVTMFPNLPSKDLSIITIPNKAGYLFLDVERAFSLAWYLPYFILFFATFEMLMILTNKHKMYSLLGSIMITLSPVVQWWQNANIIGYGALAITLFYYFINEDNKWKKLLLAILFGYSGYLYIMCLYPAWQIPYGYVYLIILIWIIIKHKEKIKLKDFLYLIPIIIVIVTPMLILYKENAEIVKRMAETAYPGARFSTGGGLWQLLFTYVADIFYPYRSGPVNAPEYSQYLSLFPIPIIYSIYLMIKNKKKDLFLILADIILICLSIWVIFPLPRLLSRITLIYMSTETRSQAVIGYLSIIEIIYILTNYELKKEKKLINKKNIFIALLSFIWIFITVYLSNKTINTEYPGYTTLLTTLISLGLFTIISMLFIYNHKNTNKVLVYILIFVTIISGIIVSPISKGLSPIYDKPLAKEIRKIVSSDEDALFVGANSQTLLADYLVANGAKTINSINYVPNLELYRELDKEGIYEDIYNRFHHLTVNLTKEETSFDLLYDDSIVLNLNEEDVCKIGIDYIVTASDPLADFNYQVIYNEYGSYIFKTNCN